MNEQQRRQRRRFHYCFLHGFNGRDDQQDPIADTARSMLDGHIVLSRRLAEAGHYPAIDTEASISRVMPQVVSSDHLKQAQLFKNNFMLIIRKNRDLISIGAYHPGSDPFAR